MKVTFLCMVLADLFIAFPAFSGQRCADAHDDFKNYLDYQKRTNTAIVYAQCGQRHGKSLLILRVVSGSTDADDGQAVGDQENQRGLLVQQLIGRCASNTAVVSISRNGADLGETAGGELTMQISDDLLQELTRYPFRFIPSRGIDEIITSKPSHTCQHVYRGWGGNY